MTSILFHAGTAFAAAALALSASSCTSLELDPRFDPAGGPLPGQGEAILGIGGSYTLSDDGDTEREGFELRLEGGSFVADEQELGLWLLARDSNVDTDPDRRSEGWGGLYYRYHLHLATETSVFVGPTVGAGLFDYGDVEGDGFGFGAQIGLRHWVSTSAALSLTPSVFWADYGEDAGGATSEFVVYWGLNLKL